MAMKRTVILSAGLVGSAMAFTAAPAIAATQQAPAAPVVQAAKPKCDINHPVLNKTITFKKGAVHVTSASKGTGYVVAKYAKWVGDGRYKAYGKKHKLTFAPKPVVCMLKGGEFALKQVSLTTLAKSNLGGRYAFGIKQDKKGRIVKINQIYQP